MFNTKILLDDTNKPSMMVRVPKFKVSDVLPGGRDIVHPAFIVNGIEVPEIYISKHQNIIVNDRAYSLPFQKPAVNLTFDEAIKACENKGAGWHLMTNAEWAAIALWCQKNGIFPRGNNDCGSDYEHQDETGIVFDGYKVLTGSGPATWAHDHTPDGIFDLNGNVWEWVGGLRLLNGEIQIVPDNNAAQHLDQSSNSNEWKPIVLDGKTVKYSETDSGLMLTTHKSFGNWSGCCFAKLETDIEAPDILKELALYPASETDRTDYFWTGLRGERLPLRGGHWYSSSSAGVFSLYLHLPRSSSSNGLGFRSAFVPA